MNLHHIHLEFFVYHLSRVYQMYPKAFVVVHKKPVRMTVFSPEFCLKKRCISLLAKETFFSPRPGATKKKCPDQQYFSEEGMVVSICWRAWQSGKGYSKLRSAEEISTRGTSSAGECKAAGSCMAALYLSTETQSVTRASVELLEIAEGLRAADRHMTEALPVAEQAVGNFMEKNKDVMALGNYMGQSVQTLERKGLQQEADYEWR
jgi:hypothetical protein